MPVPKTEVIPVRQVGDWVIAEVRGERHVPGYDADEVGRGMSETAKRREVRGDWSATPGKLVYPEFGEGHIARDPIPFDPYRELILGWDQGGTAAGGNPACVVTQVSALGQWCLFGSVCPSVEEVVGAWEFGERVAEYLTYEFADPAGIPLEEIRLIHWGDPAGNTRPPAVRGSTSPRYEARSFYDILKRGDRKPVGVDRKGFPVYEDLPGRGWRVGSGEPSFTKRSQAMRVRLTTMLPRGIPALLVDPGATDLLDAFMGGYAFHQRNDGRYELDPKKDRYSDLVNAAEYISSRLWIPRAEPPDRAARGQQWEGRAASTRRVL